MVTVIADNYFGYCKKEVKTQISFAANLYGSCEEEHAGGALAFATYVLGTDFYGDRTVSLKAAAFEDAVNLLGDMIELQPDGHAVDKLYPNVYYVPQNASFHTREGFVRWPHGDAESRLPLRAGAVYFLPNGFRVKLQKQLAGRMAHGGLKASRHSVPQALHGVRRGQIGDLEIDRRCPFEGAGIRQGLPTRHGPGGGDSRQGFLRDLSEPAARRTIATADSEPGAIARVGDPNVDALGGVHRNAQRLGESALADRAATGLHREALLPARMGRQLARTFHCGPDQRLFGTRTEIRQRETVEQLPAGRVRSKRFLANL
jgi:hypothetical protein